MRDFLTIAATVLVLFSVLPYIIDVMRGKTKPNMVSWLTWTLLTGIASAAAFAAHEPRTALLTLGSSISTGLIVLLGIRFGVAKFSLFDILCQLGAVGGLVFWLIFNSPTIGVVVPVVIDFIAMLPTLRHAYLRPHEETWTAFALSGLASVLTLLSLTKVTTVSVLYPLYLLVANWLVAGVILTRLRLAKASL